MQYRALAERVIDEMERELTDWLRQEEERPFGHYRFLHLPALGGALERSPLADGPPAPFVIVNFAIDPDGAVTSPLWPQDPQLAESVLGWRMNAEMERQRDEILSLIENLARRRTSDDDAKTVAQLKKSKLEKTAELEDSDLEASRYAQKIPTPRPKSRKVQRAPPPESPEALLSQLNRGIQSRDVRTTQIQQSQAVNVYNFEQQASDLLADALADHHGLEPDALIDVSLEPMVGRPLAAGNMLLYRTVLISDRAFRQGMVISGPLLVRHLAARVLTPEQARSKLVRL